MNFTWRKKDEALETFFTWVSHMATEKDCIFVDLPANRGYFYFEFPLKYGAKPRKQSSLPEQKEITFILHSPQNRKNVGDPWICIFSSPCLQILENKNRISGMSPLRWKLNGDEKNKALKIARDSLRESLYKSSGLTYQYFASLSPRFLSKTGLAVALWTKGSLRGSVVIEHTQLGEGIAKAAVSASRDRRFKPLSLEELPDTRIEVTVLTNLRLPLSQEELKENSIDAEKGYYLVEGRQKGWFLPEVFNVRRFADLGQFIDTLAKEKASLAGKPSLSNVFRFEIDDFIEGTEDLRAISLKGPVPFISTTGELRDRAEKAANWLIRIQEADGNFPAIFDPLTGRITRELDWPRLAFTAWALAELGRISPEKKQYKEAAEKVYFYLKIRVFDQRYEVLNRALTLAYFGNLCLALEKNEEAIETYNNLEISNIIFEPILFAQLAGFLKKISPREPSAGKLFLKLSADLKKEFENRLNGKKSMNIASWAELINTFLETDRSFSQKIRDWLISFQLPNGSFPESETSRFSYTRGTGKIFEVLALDPEKNKEALDHALTWILSMQYDEENTFFITPAVRPQILGALRHDYFNPEAWIDAVGHMLLGSTRLLSKNYGK